MTIKKLPFIFAAGVWLAIVVGFFAMLLSYETTPGLAAGAPVAWPHDTSLHRKDDVAKLVMFLHPHCPCSRASLEHLQRVLIATGVDPACAIVFVVPEGAPGGWADGSLLRRAGEIPNVRIILDPRGDKATRFNVTTSGHVLYYDVDGSLRFQGGITAKRGHVGDNKGERALLSLVKGDRDVLDQTPVYGCPLLDVAACCEGDV